MVGLYEDLRYACRGILRNRALAGISILSLALGIGANATVFTLVRALLLRPLPVADPARLVAIHTIDSNNPGLQLISFPNYQDYRDRNSVFSSLALYSAASVNLAGPGDPQLYMAHLVSGNYFQTLGVQPEAGRAFLPEEDVTPGADAVAIISYNVWTRLYGADPAVTSRTINLNHREFRIVGVAPRDFRGLSELYAADVWVPLAMYPQFSLTQWVNQRRALFFSMIGRLKPGISLAEAEARLQPLSQDLERQYPRDNAGRRVHLTTLSEATLAPKTRALLSDAGSVLMIVSLLVVLIACVNVANLLLARASGRIKEITVRLALGATRWHIARQLLAESIILAVAGGAAALLFARFARDIVWAIRPPMFERADVHLDLDPQVLWYTLALSLGTGILFGLLPALRSTKANLASDLKERTGRASNAGKWNARSILVCLQVAFSGMTLVGACLFVRSIANASRIDPGFDAAHLAIVEFNVAEQGYNEARGRDYEARALDVAAATPGVVSAALAKDIPLHVSSARTVFLDGQDVAGAGRPTLTAVVSPGYLQTVGIPLVAGRDINALDTPTAPRAAIVNQAAAAHFWPGENAIGKRLRFYGDPMPAQVAGIARNANYQVIGEDPQPLIYLSLTQYYFATNVIYLRTNRDPDAVAEAVKRHIQPLDRNLVLQTDSLGRAIRNSLWAQRLLALLLGSFGVLALLLAVIGIYGVISYSVNQRVREIGVRAALGATPRDVHRMIVGEGIRLVAIGLPIGLLVAFLAARPVTNLLFGISAADVPTFVFVPVLLTTVAVIACWIPAVRATRVSPSIALRDE